MGEKEKEKYEQWVFAQFAEAAKLYVKAGSVQSEKPPKPDLSCEIEGQTHYFELRQVVDENLARRHATQPTPGHSGGFYSQDDPLVLTFKAKALKDYGDLDGPLHFVAYYNEQHEPSFTELEVSTKTQLLWIMEGMRIGGKWSSVWIYSVWTKAVLYSCFAPGFSLAGYSA